MTENETQQGSCARNTSSRYDSGPSPRYVLKSMPGPMFGNAKGKPANLNNTLNKANSASAESLRDTRKAKPDHIAASISHQFKQMIIHLCGTVGTVQARPSNNTVWLGSR